MVITSALILVAKINVSPKTKAVPLAVPIFLSFQRIVDVSWCALYKHYSLNKTRGGGYGQNCILTQAPALGIPAKGNPNYTTLCPESKKKKSQMLVC
jgi:hypothetical protein